MVSVSTVISGCALLNLSQKNSDINSVFTLLRIMYAKLRHSK